MAGWGRLVSTPLPSNPHVYFGNTPVLFRTAQQGRGVLLLLSPKPLFNPAVRRPILHNVGVSGLGLGEWQAPPEGGSCQVWEVWFCPQRDHSVHFHLTLNSEAFPL